MRNSFRRIEPGYYKLRKTPIEIRNVQGMSVRFTGLIIKPWRVHDGHDGWVDLDLQPSFNTLAEAKVYAIELADQKGY